VADTLTERHCQRDAERLDNERIGPMLAQLHDDWALSDNGAAIRRTVRFKNYYQTIAFVNALAWIAHAEDHHPDLEVGYNRCVVNFSTHSAGGLSANDFICAAHLDALIPVHAR